MADSLRICKARFGFVVWKIPIDLPGDVELEA